MRDFMYIGTPPAARPADAKRMIETICRRYLTTWPMVRTQQRTRALVECRRTICVELTKMGLTSGEIGRLLNRDHTTVLHHLQVAGVRGRAA